MTRQKKMALFRVFGIALACGMFLLFTLGSTLGKPGRDPVTGSGEALADMVTGHAEGEATLYIRGEQYDATVEVQITGFIELKSGVQHVEATHTFTFEDESSFTTTDKELAVPTGTPGLYTLHANMKITGGDYEGKLIAIGQIQFVSLTEAVVTYDLHGVISSPESE